MRLTASCISQHWYKVSSDQHSMHCCFFYISLEGCFNSIDLTEILVTKVTTGNEKKKTLTAVLYLAIHVCSR